MLAPAAPAPLDALVERGVAAAKQGDGEQALALFAEALARDPRHELAWLWLSGVVATDAERRYCLEQVVAVNPLHHRAQLGLAYLPADSGAQSPLVRAAKPAGSCTESGCQTPVARPGHTRCYPHWKAHQQGGPAEGAAVPARLTAAVLGERFG